MKLREVRQWASRRGVSVEDFRRVYDKTLLFTISRLLQAMYRESQACRLSRDERGRWHLDVGNPADMEAFVGGVSKGVLTQPTTPLSTLGG